MNECGCNDWMTTQRSAMMRAQGQRVPLPRAILEGANAAVCRRDFLRNGALGLPHRVRRIARSRGARSGRRHRPRRRQPDHRPDHRLDLPGRRQRRHQHARPDRLDQLPGLPGRRARTSASRIRRKLLPLGGAAANPDFAWNPAATGLQSLYDAGKMAVIPAVDYSPPDLSHFHSRAFWQAGDLVTDPTTGWLGRWIDQNGDP